MPIDRSLETASVTWQVIWEVVKANLRFEIGHYPEVRGNVPPRVTFETCRRRISRSSFLANSITLTPGI